MSSCQFYVVPLMCACISLAILVHKLAVLNLYIFTLSSFYSPVGVYDSTVRQLVAPFLPFPSYKYSIYFLVYSSVAFYADWNVSM